MAATSSDGGKIDLEINHNNNTIAGGTLTSSENTKINVQVNDWTSISGAIITSTQFSEIDLNFSGVGNSVSGLTLSGSGTSLTSFNMPANGFSDVGRTVVAMLSDVKVITINWEWMLFH